MITFILKIGNSLEETGRPQGAQMYWLYSLAAACRACLPRVQHDDASHGYGWAEALSVTKRRQDEAINAMVRMSKTKRALFRHGTSYFALAISAGTALGSSNLLPMVVRSGCHRRVGSIPSIPRLLTNSVRPAPSRPVPSATAPPPPPRSSALPGSVRHRPARRHRLAALARPKPSATAPHVAAAAATQIRRARLRPPPPRPHAAAAPPLSDGAEEDAEGQVGLLRREAEALRQLGCGVLRCRKALVDGTYPSAHEAARSYDVAVWRAERPRSQLNFPKIETRAEAKMIVPKGINMKEITMKKKKTKKPSVVVSVGETDEEVMARFSREHPEYVQAELEYYWKREAEQKKKGPKKEDEASPSTVIPIESSSEEDWADFSEEEEEEEEEEWCDDPAKEDFWARSEAPTMRSSLSSSLNK
nr:ethylene-responsive transcription factor 2-like [Triticum aestivum]